MKAAVISDIHSNLEALQAVLKDIKKRRIKKIFCLGDLVGYGANPNECVDLCLKESDAIVAGNHDWALVGKTDINRFNPVAAQAIRWTKKHITEANFDKLKDLPLTQTTSGIMLVHAAPRSPEEWAYLTAFSDFQEAFNSFSEPLCFIGHTHIPCAAFQDANSYMDVIRENPFPLIPKRRFIINVGSVGQPRDYDPRACYGIYDGNNATMEIIRIEYNIPLTEQKIMDAGLPEILAQRLSVGK
jgi:diadenosine tetraphosphatase ApaH/serine/threonine PP2A family protein phosphatase